MDNFVESVMNSVSEMMRSVVVSFGWAAVASAIGLAVFSVLVLGMMSYKSK